MEYIQIVDGVENCVYDIFAVSEKEFSVLFPNETDIAFIDEIYAREDSLLLDEVLKKMYSRPTRKSDAQGLHGIIFFDLEEKKKYYPTRKDAEAINPNGSPLR